ncbi:hypothetical protein ACKI6Z_06285 [Staphylococcus epidermidis]|nr:hypothetical protein [Staphylococcus epidermidis]
MNCYDTNTIETNYKNINVLNKYYINEGIFPVAERFVEHYRINGTQKIISLKYNAITYNLFTTMYFIDEYTFNSHNDFKKMMNLQSGNFYLQAAYDNLYQLLYFMTFSNNKNELLFKDDHKRYQVEASFRIIDFIKNNRENIIVKELKKLYKSKMATIRKSNNYVKHNGQLEDYEKNTAEAYEVEFNQDDILQGIRKAKYNLENNINPMVSKVPKGKKIDLIELSHQIYLVVDDLLQILDKTMEIYIDDSYREMVRITNNVYL